MNSIGEDVINGITESISIAEKDYKGLVIGNQVLIFQLVLIFQ